MTRVPVLGALALIAASACGGSTPTAPETFLTVSCNASAILAGDTVFCAAKIGSTNVGWAQEAVWAASDPLVVRSEGAGLFTGRSDGQAVLSVTYAGEKRSALLTVSLEDRLRISGASPGPLTVGTARWMYMQGVYGVASADTGTLTMVIEDQAGATIHTSTPITLPRGGDHYVIWTPVTPRAGTTRVCQKAVLEIGARTITAVPESSLVACFDVWP